MSANSPSPSTARVLEQELFRNAMVASGLQRVAFLAGPYIETEKGPRKAKKNIASRLRFDLYHKLIDEGWTVTLGEYQALVDATKPLAGDHNNAALAEVHHAKSKELDAVVMLPSSPGSFLELGAFSSIETICQKMVIVVDLQYETHLNYMNEGPVKLAKSFGAQVEFCDYSDLNACWVIVKTYITNRMNLGPVDKLAHP
jgi:hypothetical protein